MTVCALTAINMPLLTLQNVHYTVAGKPILRDIDLSVGQEAISIIGQNGAGKSTLAKIMLGIVRPTSGTVMRASNAIGYVPQKFAPNPTLPMRVSAFLPKDILFADALGIAPLLDKPLLALSGGEMQRVLFAKALANRPKILVLDEPMQGLDLTSEVLLLKLLQDLPALLGAAVITISHDVHWVMANSTRVLCIDGHICCQGKPADIARAPDFLRRFGYRPYVHQTHHCTHPHKER